MIASLSFALLLLLLPGVAPEVRAQPAPRDSAFQLRVFGDVVVGRDAREGAVVVIKGNATIEGTVRAVVVLGGNVAVNGGRVEDLTVVGGHATVGPGGLVSHEVHLIDAEMTVAEGGRVTATIERGAGRRLARDVAGFAALLSLGVLIALLLGGVIAAEVAPQGVRRAGDMLRADTGRVAIGALMVWIALPVGAAMLVPTVLGLPLGLGYFLFLLPIFWYLGLIVAGTWVGDQVLGRLRQRVAATRPWLAAVIGIALLLVLGRLPLIGLLSFVLVALGSGTVALTIWRALKGR